MLFLDMKVYFFEFQTIYITVVRGKPFFLVSQGEKGNCFPVMGH